MKLPEWNPNPPPEFDWQRRAKKMNDLTEFNPGKILQKFQGPKGVGQGSWGALAPKFVPMSARKKAGS